MPSATTEIRFNPTSMNRHPKSRGIQDWSQSKSETEFLPASVRNGATFFPPFALALVGARALQPDFEHGWRHYRFESVA
jgi:hypothetical protein